jgi:hypothetical protein
MRRSERLLAIAAVVLLIGAVKLVQYTYTWYAYAEERRRIVALEDRVEDAGLGVVLTQIRADSLRAAIEAIDSELASQRNDLDSYERRAARGRISSGIEATYREDLASYNRGVRERNELFRRWDATVGENHAQVGRYNTLADSVRTLAAQIGDPYYPIPSPAEIADREGIFADRAEPP